MSFEYSAEVHLRDGLGEGDQKSRGGLGGKRDTGGWQERLGSTCRTWIGEQWYEGRSRSRCWETYQDQAIARYPGQLSMLGCYTHSQFSKRQVQHQRCFWVRVINFLQLLLHSFASEENRELLRVLLILVLDEGKGVPSILQISAWISFRHLRKKPPFLDHSRDGSANYGETIKYTTMIAKVHPDKVSLSFFWKC